jgi:ATP-dependent DNA ligase
VAAVPAERFILDSEIVIPIGDEFSFDDLLQRIHPAASRVKKLAQTTPAVIFVFDILADESGNSTVELPLSARRELLDKFAASFLGGNKTIFLSPATTDADVTEEWRNVMGDRLDGIMAKRLNLPYQSGNRKGMVKVKKMRTADCVIGGFRYASGAAGKQSVGSLLLGLYNDELKLDHVGFSSSFTAKEKKELLTILQPLLAPPGFTGNAPGGPSRWATERSTEWEPLKPELVAEVRYDHFTQGRFRHGTKFMRWRPDKRPDQCNYTQLKQHARAI